jgi:hypothetical protein
MEKLKPYKNIESIQKLKERPALNLAPMMTFRYVTSTLKQIGIEQKIDSNTQIETGVDVNSVDDNVIHWMAMMKLYR